MLQCDRDHDAQILNTAAAPDLYSGARQEHLGQAHIQEKGAIPRWSISTIGRSFAIFISRLPQLPDRHPSASRSENGISGRRSRTSVSVMRYHGRRRIAGRSFRKEPMFPASGASRGSKPATTCGPPPVMPEIAGIAADARDRPRSLGNRRAPTRRRGAGRADNSSPNVGLGLIPETRCSQPQGQLSAHPARCRASRPAYLSESGCSVSSAGTRLRAPFRPSAWINCAIQVGIRFRHRRLSRSLWSPLRVASVRSSTRLRSRNYRKDSRCGQFAQQRSGRLGPFALHWYPRKRA